MPSQSEWVSGGGAIPLLFEVQVDLLPASGLKPTVEVLRYPDNFVADWQALDFVAQGSAVSGLAQMSGVPSSLGIYRRDFDPAKFGEAASAKQTYMARYRVTIPSGYAPGVNEDLNVLSHEVHIFTGSLELFGSFNGS